METGRACKGSLPFRKPVHLAAWVESSVRGCSWSGVEDQVHRMHPIAVPCIPLPASDHAKKGRSDVGEKAIGVSHVHDDWCPIGKVAETLEELLDM